MQSQMIKSSPNTLPGYEIMYKCMFGHFWAILGLPQVLLMKGAFLPQKSDLDPLRQPRIAQRGGYGLKTLPITIYAWAPLISIILTPFGAISASKLAQCHQQWDYGGCFKVKTAHLMKRTWGRPEWPKSGQTCILTLFHIQGGYLVMIWSSGAAWRGLWYFLPVVIF